MLSYSVTSRLGTQLNKSTRFRGHDSDTEEQTLLKQQRRAHKTHLTERGDVAAMASGGAGAGVGGECVWHADMHEHRIHERFSFQFFFGSMPGPVAISLRAKCSKENSSGANGREQQPSVHGTARTLPDSRTQHQRRTPAG